MEKNRGRFMDDDDDDELKVLLPPEIVNEILSRLPAVSAIKCRGICKQWRSLIDHPSFEKFAKEEEEEPKVVNPLNPMFRYGDGTRIKKWSMVRNGYIVTCVLPLPPLKQGEPITKLEQDANKEAKEQAERCREWRAEQDDRASQMYCQMHRNRVAELVAQHQLTMKAQLEQEKEMMIRYKAKQANRRRKETIKARNFPCRAFPLLKNLLMKKKKKKKKNASGCGKLASG